METDTHNGYKFPANLFSLRDFLFHMDDKTLITVDAAKIQLSIALTKMNLLVQTLQTRADKLIIDDDPEHMEEVQVFLKDSKSALKIVDDSHKEIKKPFFEAGKACDAAKNDLTGIIEGILKPVNVKYTAVCNEIDRKKQEAAQKKAKEEGIKTGVEANILDFATRIAGCKTKKDLTEVESIINLEKSPSRATKYGEWHEYAINRYNDTLLPIIKDQKVKVDEFEKLAAALAKENDPTKADELQTKIDAKENEIIQNQVKVQESALNQVTPASTNEVEEILPDLTKAGSNMEVEIVDLKLVFKKHPELLNIELKKIDTKKLGATLRDAGAFKGFDELVFDGIKFKIEKRWK